MAFCIPTDDNKSTLPDSTINPEQEYQRFLREAKNDYITLTPTPVPTPLLTPIPTVVPTLPPAANVVFLPQNEVEAQFFAGYRDAGVGASKDENHIWRVINCESTWNPLTQGIHWGLAQFLPSTWWTVVEYTGFTDWTNSYHQGYNMAVWSSLIPPGSTAGWPHCWHQ